MPRTRKRPRQIYESDEEESLTSTAPVLGCFSQQEPPVSYVEPIFSSRPSRPHIGASLTTHKHKSILHKSPHTEFIPIFIHTAICDRCGKRNSSVLQRCCTCNKQLCHGCMYDDGGDGDHIPNEQEVDWTDRGAQSGSRKRNRGEVKRYRKPASLSGQRVTRQSTATRKKGPLQVRLLLPISEEVDSTGQEISTPHANEGIFVREDDSNSDSAVSNDTIDFGLGTRYDSNRMDIDTASGIENTNWQSLRCNSKLINPYKEFNVYLARAKVPQEACQTNPIILRLLNEGREDEADEMLQAANSLLRMSESL